MGVFADDDVPNPYFYMPDKDEINLSRNETLPCPVPVKGQSADLPCRGELRCGKKEASTMTSPVFKF